MKLFVDKHYLAKEQYTYKALYVCVIRKSVPHRM